MMHTLASGKKYYGRLYIGEEPVGPRGGVSGNVVSGSSTHLTTSSLEISKKIMRFCNDFGVSKGPADITIDFGKVDGEVKVNATIEQQRPYPSYSYRVY